MEGLRGGLSPGRLSADLLGGSLSGSLSLAPNFVPWAAIGATLLLIAGGVAWLVLHDPMLRVLRRLWLADLVAAWLLYAAGYHLVFLERLRPVLGRPLALWLLCAGLGAYVLLRRLPTPLRRPEVALWVAVLLWAALIAAGQRYVQETEADAALLAERPQAVLSADAPDLRPLWRALLLTRLEAPQRDATLRVLAALQGAVQPEARQPEAQPPHPALLGAYRIAHVPRVLEHYRYDLAKLRTYLWLQAGLLLVVLLVWGFGHLPEWESL